MSQYTGIIDIIEREAVALQQKVDLANALKQLGSLEDGIVAAQSHSEAAHAELAKVQEELASAQAELAHAREDLAHALAAKVDAEVGLAAIRADLHKLVNVSAAK